ncbi:PucR family transcriptional regulator [Mediterraneibacter massiliensis]|uniref:PucR family transcriptional regulator n=1 Tax=Mediterraneibacter massiliensis TaxID=1720300 RepID=UPI0024ADCE52|nr:PucR family transcriptional regulator [Mediterraneibacter massiliensis]
MADRFFQGYVYQLQNSISRTFGVIDNREIISCSNQELIGQKNTFSLMNRSNEEKKCFVEGKNTYRIFYENRVIRFAVFVEGIDQKAEDYATILSVCFTGMKSYFEEKYNQQLFYKNLFLENILSEDVNVRANMLKIPLLRPRVVYLLRFCHIDPQWEWNSLFQDMEEQGKYEAFAMTETDVILIVEVRANTSREELEKMGKYFQEKAEALFASTPVVGIGNIVSDIRKLKESYKESLHVLALLYLFQDETTVLQYNHLGINRLIYQLPLPLCERYLNEVFIKGGFDSLDEETLDTVNCFFENDLNVSETARQLFIHRNTLMYRLEKIRKLTGLDIRVFDEAIIFKLAMVIHRHVKHKE